MISQDYAIGQLERIMGMVGFPRGKDSGSYVREMRKALASSRTEAIASRVIDDILREFKRCPAVSDIYEMVSEENGRVLTEKQPKCRTCDGIGAVTVFLLVTYHGRSLTVRSQEVVPNMAHERAQEFGKNLRWDDGPITEHTPFRGDNQQIITAAKKCPECRP